MNGRSLPLGNAKVAFQSALTRLGPLCSPRVIFALNRAVDYLEIGRWMRSRGFDVAHRVASRTALFELAASEVTDRRVLYMEFGVSNGASLRYWTTLLPRRDSIFHGFDSFEGLPEAWNTLNPKGQFSTGGELPLIGDDRVRLFKGWFEDTLPEYEWPAHDQLIVNIDADLYSSTQYVLNFVAPKLTKGSFLYFDELMDRDHELRAFSEFLDSSHMSFVVRGATRTLTHVLFERV